MMETDTNGSKSTQEQAPLADSEYQEPAIADLEYVHGDARMSIISEPDGILAYWWLSAKGIARGQARVPVGQSAHLVLRVYVEYADGRKRTQDHGINRWIDHVRIPLPSTARRVVGAIGFRDVDGFGHMVRSAPIQRNRNKPGHSPLKSSRVAFGDQGIECSSPNSMSVSDVGKVLKRGFIGRGFQELIPESDAPAPALIKKPRALPALAQPAQVCLCIVHDFGIPHQAGLNSKVDYIIDVCLPLIAVLRALEANAVSSSFTLALSPELLEFLGSAICVESVAAELSIRLEGHGAQEHTQLLAAEDLARLVSLQEVFRILKGDLIGEYARLHRGTRIELVTTMATKAPLTDMAAVPEAIQIQTRSAVQVFTRHFGFAPQGMVLTDAGYFSSFDGVLAKSGLRYAIVDHRTFTGANAPLQFGTAAAVHSPNSGLAYVAADPLFQHWQPLSEQRCDQWYRDSKRRSVLPALDKKWGASARGLHGQPKTRYVPVQGRQAAEQQAEAWWLSHRARLNRATKKSDQPLFMAGVLSASDLVGQWFEGPDFIQALGFIAARDQGLALGTVSESLDQVAVNQTTWLGPVISSQRAAMSLPYFAPRIEYITHRIRTAMNALQTGEQPAEIVERIRSMVSALLCAHAALALDGASSAHCIRQCIEFVDGQSQALESYFQEGKMPAPMDVQLSWIDVFQSLDIQNLTTA